MSLESNKSAAATAYREARGDMDGPQFKKLTGLLDEFFSEEAKEPEHKKADATTADYRTQARAAKDRLEWDKAADLYQKAIDAYPVSPGALAEKDKSNMREEIRNCRSMARGDSARTAKLDAALKKADSIAAKADEERFPAFAERHLGAKWVVAKPTEANKARYPGAKFITQSELDAVKAKFRKEHPEAAKAYFG